MNTQIRCQCACGQVQFSTRDVPLLRFICHCTICQNFNQAPHGDYSVFRLGDVELPPADAVRYGAYRPPPAIQRGQCAACGRPALELMQLPLLPQLAFVPTAVLQNSAGVPPPALHTFYHRRRADHNDSLPKLNGYLPSQIAFMWKLLSAMLRRKAAK